MLLMKIKTSRTSYRGKSVHEELIVGTSLQRLKKHALEKIKAMSWLQLDDEVNDEFSKKIDNLTVIKQDRIGNHNGVHIKGIRDEENVNPYASVSIWIREIEFIDN